MAPPGSEIDRRTLPVVEERAVIGTRKRLTGGVRARTVVRENEAVVPDQALRSEQVEVERTPLDRWVEAPVPIRQEGDTTIITLHEEVVVVKTRLKAIEEVCLTTKRHETRSAPERVTLRREEVVLERLEMAEDTANPA